jgi:hypothetical protein
LPLGSQAMRFSSCGLKRLCTSTSATLDGC